MNKQEIIEEAEKAYLKTDWYEDILNLIQDPYSKGYIAAKVEYLTDSYDSTSELFREEFVILLNNAID